MKPIFLSIFSLTAFAQQPMPSPFAVSAGGGVYAAYSPSATHMSGGGIASGIYTSGGTITGTATQTCNLAITGGGSGATATVALTGTNTIAGGTVLTITAAGTLYGTAPVAATMSSGTATCSGSATISTVLTGITTTGSAYSQWGKNVFVVINVTGVSDGSAPAISLPVQPLNQGTLLQTLACAWSNDSGIWVGAVANPNVNATPALFIYQYNQASPGANISHSYACNGVYQSQ